MKKTISIVVALIVLGAGSVLWRVYTTPPDTPPKPAPSTEDSDALIIAFGDSLTAGYGLPIRESYPAILETSLRSAGASVRVVNAGISGETTAGARERATFIRAQNPDVVLLGIGANDALRFLALTDTEQNMRAILDALTTGENAPTVLLLRMRAPSNAGGAYQATFDALYPTLAEEYAVELVPFLEEEVFRNPAYLQSDGIHPTAEGYTYLVETYLRDAVLEVL